MLGWAILLAAARPSRAQTVTKVRIPSSATTRFVADACTVTAPKPIVDAAGTLTTASRVEVSVENDQNKSTNAGVDLSLVAGKQTAKIDATSATAVIQGNLTGETLTITKGDNVLVCALTLPLPPDAPEDTTLRAFRVGIGGSFDFINGISGTNLYSDLTVFLPSLWTRTAPFRRDSSRTWQIGIDAGVYNGRTLPRQDSTVSEPVEAAGRTRYLPRTSVTDSARRVRQIVNRTRTESVDRLGAYLAPTVRLTRGLHFLVQSELVKRDFLTETRERVVSQDTVTVAPIATLPLGGAGTLNPTDTTIKTRSTRYLAVHSIGVLLNVRVKDIELRAKPTIGFMREDSTQTVAPGRRGVYAAQFRVTDFEHGFKIGGDVRGLLNGDETTFLLYLAKDFSFKRLASFLLGDGEDGE